jgi:ABC-type sugar transport system ATPase subunit
LVGSPRLLLLDEPFSNLDALHKNIIRSVIGDVSAQLTTSCIMVSHEAADTLSWADTILVLKDGELIQTDGPEEIYYHPLNEYCAGLFGEYNLIDPGNAMILQPSLNPIPPAKKMLVRPEQFVVERKAGALKGFIKNKSFMGSYYTLEVAAGAQVIKVKTADHSFGPGGEVWLSLQAAAWYI